MKITESYEMFAGKQTKLINFRCTPKVKEFIEYNAKVNKLNIKDYLIKLVLNDYDSKQGVKNNAL